MVSANLNEVAHAIGRSGDADCPDWFTGDVNDRRADSGDIVVSVDCCPSGASGVLDFVAHVVKVDDEVVEVGVGDEMVDKLVGLVCGHRGEDGAAHRGDVQWKGFDQFGSPMVIFIAGFETGAAGIVRGGPARRGNQVGPVPQCDVAATDSADLLQPRAADHHVVPELTPAYVVSGGTGSPADSTLLLPLYLYQEAFNNFWMGYAAGLAWVLVLVIGAFTAAHFALSRYWVFYPNDRK